MKGIFTAFGFMVIIFLPWTLTSQTTEEYFTSPGLSINAYHFNYYDGTYSTSYSYFRKDTLCTEELLIYVNNQEGYRLYLDIDGDKVYYVSPVNCQKFLLYDFGLQVGEVLPEGMYQDFEVLAIYDVLMDNGETRKRFDLKRDNYSISWIQGIGDIHHGLYPFLEDFEGYDVFVCAKAGDEMLWSNIEELDTCAYYSCVIPVPAVDYEIEGYTVSFDNQSIFATSFEWDFGDGQLSTEPNPVHTYDTLGCYVVTMKAYSECHTEGVDYLQNIPVCIGDPWREEYAIDTFFSLNISRYSENLEFIYSIRNLYKTYDGGNNWMQLAIPEAPAGVNRRINALEMFDEQRGIIGCGHYGAEGDQKALLLTNDGGLTWEEKAEESYFILRLELAPDGRAWALGQYRYFRSFDYGDTWEKISYTGGFSIYNIQFIHDSLLIGRSFTGLQPNGTYHLVKSIDDGLTWEQINLPLFVREWQFLDEDNGYGFRDGYGLSRTTDGGLQWDPIPLPFEIKAYAFFSVDTGWVMDITGLVYYTTDGLKSYTISNCGRTILNKITPISGTSAYAIAGQPLGSSSTGKAKVIFDQLSIVNCTSTDHDQDGYPEESDCNDDNPFIHPNQPELVYNGLDDDCDTTTLDDDLDQDGFALADDCDDLSPGIHPNATDIPDNGIDEDCDGNDLTTSVTGMVGSSMKIYPNPTSGYLTIETENPEGYLLKIIDPSGLLHFSGRAASSLDLRFLHEGLYFLEFIYTSTGNKQLEKLVLLSR